MPSTENPSGFHLWMYNSIMPKAVDFEIKELEQKGLPKELRQKLGAGATIAKWFVRQADSFFSWCSSEYRNARAELKNRITFIGQPPRSPLSDRKITSLNSKDSSEQSEKALVAAETHILLGVSQGQESTMTKAVDSLARKEQDTKPKRNSWPIIASLAVFALGGLGLYLRSGTTNPETLSPTTSFPTPAPGVTVPTQRPTTAALRTPTVGTAVASLHHDYSQLFANQVFPQSPLLPNPALKSLVDDVSEVALTRLSGADKVESPDVGEKPTPEEVQQRVNTAATARLQNVEKETAKEKGSWIPTLSSLFTIPRVIAVTVTGIAGYIWRKGKSEVEEEEGEDPTAAIKELLKKDNVQREQKEIREKQNKEIRESFNSLFNGFFLTIGIGDTSTMRHINRIQLLLNPSPIVQEEISDLLLHIKQHGNLPKNDRDYKDSLLQKWFNEHPNWGLKTLKDDVSGRNAAREVKDKDFPVFAPDSQEANVASVYQVLFFDSVQPLMNDLEDKMLNPEEMKEGEVPQESVSTQHYNDTWQQIIEVYQAIPQLFSKCSSPESLEQAIFHIVAQPELRFAQKRKFPDSKLHQWLSQRPLNWTSIEDQNALKQVIPTIVEDSFREAIQRANLKPEESIDTEAHFKHVKEQLSTLKWENKDKSMIFEEIRNLIQDSQVQFLHTKLPELYFVLPWSKKVPILVYAQKYPLVYTRLKQYTKLISYQTLEMEEKKRTPFQQAWTQTFIAVLQEIVGKAELSDEEIYRLITEKAAMQNQKLVGLIQATALSKEYPENQMVRNMLLDYDEIIESDIFNQGHVTKRLETCRHLFEVHKNVCRAIAENPNLEIWSDPNKAEEFIKTQARDLAQQYPNSELVKFSECVALVLDIAEEPIAAVNPELAPAQAGKGKARSLRQTATAVVAAEKLKKARWVTRNLNPQAVKAKIEEFEEAMYAYCKVQLPGRNVNAQGGTLSHLSLAVEDLRYQAIVTSFTSETLLNAINDTLKNTWIEGSILPKHWDGTVHRYETSEEKFGELAASSSKSISQEEKGRLHATFIQHVNNLRNQGKAKGDQAIFDTQRHALNIEVIFRENKSVSGQELIDAVQTALSNKEKWPHSLLPQLVGKLWWEPLHPAQPLETLQDLDLQPKPEDQAEASKDQSKPLPTISASSASASSAAKPPDQQIAKANTHALGILKSIRRTPGAIEKLPQTDKEHSRVIGLTFTKEVLSQPPYKLLNPQWVREEIYKIVVKTSKSYPESTWIATCKNWFAKNNYSLPDIEAAPKEQAGNAAAESRRVELQDVAGEAAAGAGEIPEAAAEAGEIPEAAAPEIPEGRAAPDVEGVEGEKVEGKEGVPDIEAPQRPEYLAVGNERLGWIGDKFKLTSDHLMVACMGLDFDMITFNALLTDHMHHLYYEEDKRRQIHPPSQRLLGSNITTEHSEEPVSEKNFGIEVFDRAKKKQRISKEYGIPLTVRDERNILQIANAMTLPRKTKGFGTLQEVGSLFLNKLEQELNSKPDSENSFRVIHRPGKDTGALIVDTRQYDVEEDFTEYVFHEHGLAAEKPGNTRYALYPNRRNYINDILLTGKNGKKSLRSINTHAQYREIAELGQLFKADKSLGFLPRYLVQEDNLPTKDVPICLSGDFNFPADQVQKVLQAAYDREHGEGKIRVKNLAKDVQEATHVSGGNKLVAYDAVFAIELAEGAVTLQGESSTDPNLLYPNPDDDDVVLDNPADCDYNRYTATVGALALLGKAPKEGPEEFKAEGRRKKSLGSPSADSTPYGLKSLTNMVSSLIPWRRS